MTRALNKRGEAGLIWYIIYLGAAVLILGTITYLGVNTFTVHSETDQLQREYIYEYLLDYILEQDAYTGEQNTLASDLETRLQRIHQDDNSFAMRVKVDTTTHYSDEATYNQLLARIGTSSELRSKKMNVDGQDVEIIVVMQS